MHRALSLLGLVVASVVVACALGGCSALNLTSSPTDPKWVEVPIHAVDRENLHEACLHAVKSNHLDVEDSNVAEGKIQSKWSEELSVFQRQWQDTGGWRRRAYVEITAADASSTDAKQGYERLVRVRVEREKNMQPKNPNDSKSAKWEPAEDDVDMAKRIAVTVQSLLTEFRPSDDFYRRHGMQPPAKPGESPQGPP